jgi:hypothetical protein
VNRPPAAVPAISGQLIVVYPLINLIMFCMLAVADYIMESCALER